MASETKLQKLRQIRAFVCENGEVRVLPFVVRITSETVILGFKSLQDGRALKMNGVWPGALSFRLSRIKMNFDEYDEYKVGIPLQIWIQRQIQLNVERAISDLQFVLNAVEPERIDKGLYFDFVWYPRGKMDFWPKDTAPGCSSSTHTLHALDFFDINNSDKTHLNELLSCS